MQDILVLKDYSTILVLTLGVEVTFSYTFRDYRPIPALDVYDQAVLDDEENYDEMDPEARREAERLMRKRDREDAAARGRLHRGLLYGINQIINSYGFD